jgi:hypothetical protein
VLCTEPDGSLDGGSHGLLHRDARLLSRHQLTVGEESPTLVSAARPDSDSWVGVLRVARPGGKAEGPQLPQDSLEVVLRRTVGPGVLERIQVTNHSAVPCRGLLRLALDADFADVAELKGERQQEGTIDRHIEQGRSLRFTYRVAVDGKEDERGIEVGVEDATVTIEAHGIVLRHRSRPRSRSARDFRHDASVRRARRRTLVRTGR